MALGNPASRSSRVLIGQFERKPPESCQKDVTELSKTETVGLPRLEYN